MVSYINEKYIRVSSISSAFAKYGKVPQHILDRAASRGSAVHGLIYDTMNHIVIPSERWEFMGAKLNGYFESFLDFYSQYEGANIISQEEEIKCDLHMIAGTPDLIIRHQGKTILLDWKCAYKTGKHWNIQGSGYHYLASKRGQVDEVLFVRLDKDGKYPEIMQVTPNWVEFFAAYDLYKQYLQDPEINLEME